MISNFFWPSVGGILIGLSATLVLLTIGRIAGISGIVWNALSRGTYERAWRWVFIVGLLAGTWLFHFFSGQAYPELNQNFILAGIAGLLVGVGTKIGNGCTSGHSVCGLGRFSVRSLAATVVFMLTAIATVFVFNSLSTAGGLS